MAVGAGLKFREQLRGEVRERASLQELLIISREFRSHQRCLLRRPKGRLGSWVRAHRNCIHQPRDRRGGWMHRNAEFRRAVFDAPPIKETRNRDPCLFCLVSSRACVVCIVHSCVFQRIGCNGSWTGCLWRVLAERARVESVNRAARRPYSCASS